MTTRRFQATSATLILAVAFALAPVTAQAKAKITIQNADGPGEGFNDPTPVAPIGGNTGTTLGQQRLNSFQAAADIWSNLLTSSVEIIIKANFDPLTCTSTSATLGAAGPSVYATNFPKAPLADVWYPIALADALAGEDQNPGVETIQARFNSSIDNGCFSGTKWYYGLDGNHGNDIDLVVTLLHEFGHGLGFTGSTRGDTGKFLAGSGGTARPGLFDFHILDLKSGMHWNQMDDAGRAASAISDNIVWDGPSVRPAATMLLVSGSIPVLSITAPASIAHDLNVGTAAFGSALTTSGLATKIVAAKDPVETAAGSSDSDACSALTNPSEVHGNIALVDRGICTFVVKAKNAQSAGAIGVIIVDNVSSCVPPGLGGTDTTVTIPVISVTQSDGNAIRAQLAAGVNATMKSKTTRYSGADDSGDPKLYAPCAFSAGSSVYHWDTTAKPNLLMEPNISPDLGHGVDLTINELIDIGWTSTMQPPAVWSGRRSLKRGHP
jgi:hypothetical protein